MDVEQAIKEMMADPKIQEILEALGSDYDEDGNPYWDKDV
jgi:uncharacterized protein YeeX (DUF496 family)